MNPKYPANLDPKLREAYDRVMGTGVPQSPPAQPQHEEPPKAPVKMVTEPAQKHEESNSDSTVVHFSADTHKHKKPEEKPEVKQAAATHTEATPEEKSTVTPILIGIIGVLFFLGYALFWAQIFGFSVLPTF